MSRADSQARTRERLLQSATRIFEKRGFAAATVDDISAGAGFSRGAFYANFADKADIFLTVVEQRREQVFAELERALAAAADSEILGVMYEWFIRVLVQDPLARAFTELTLAHTDRRLRRRLGDNVRAVHELTARLVAEYCQRHGVTLAVDERTFATMVVAIVDGYAGQLRLDPALAPPDAIARALTALWTGVVQEAPPR